MLFSPLCNIDDIFILFPSNGSGVPENPPYNGEHQTICICYFFKENLLNIFTVICYPNNCYQLYFLFF